MIEIKKAFGSISNDELNHLLDGPVWLSLLASITNDGVVNPSEKADAVRLAHLRTFTSPKSLQEFYEKVDQRFDERFDTLHSRLTMDNENDKTLYIKAQIEIAHKVLEKLDKDIAASLEESFSSFYEHVFKADKSFFQYFALPIISNRLDKVSGNFSFKK